MDKLVRKIEVPLARHAIEKAGLYLVEKKDLDRLAETAADAYQDYPLHNWFTKGKYDKVASQLLMEISLKTMTEDAVIYADSEQINGFAVWLPFGFTGNKAIPFLTNGGFKLIFHSGPGIIGKLLTYENYAMKLKLGDNLISSGLITIEQLEKLGDTPFVSTSTLVTSDDNIFIQIKELNDLRRTLTNNLMTKRMEVNVNFVVKNEPLQAISLQPQPKVISAYITNLEQQRKEVRP